LNHFNADLHHKKDSYYLNNRISFFPSNSRI
jgi:hypothetical protein